MPHVFMGHFCFMSYIIDWTNKWLARVSFKKNSNFIAHPFFLFV